MKLYYCPGACSLSVHIALIESGLPFETEAVNLRAQPHTTASGKLFSEINPKGYVPALVLDDGTVLSEAQVVLQYVADHAKNKIAPEAKSIKHYEMQEWLAYVATEIHKGYGLIWSPDASEKQKTDAKTKIDKRYALIEQQLSKTDYLVGDFSVADCYLYVNAGWYGPMPQWPALTKFMERMNQRPAVKQALAAEKA